MGWAGNCSQETSMGGAEGISPYCAVGEEGFH